MAEPPARPGIDRPWHALACQEVLQALQVDLVTGLCASQVRHRAACHGLNVLPEAPARPAWRAFARQFRSPLIYILFAAAVFAVALGHRGDAAVSFGWFAWRLQQGGPLEVVRTETFTVLAMCQWFNVLNCQSATASALGLGVLRNRWLLGGLTLSVALQALVIYAPLMNELFHTVALAPATLLPLLALASAVLWVEELRKLIVRAGPRLRRGPHLA